MFVATKMILVTAPASDSGKGGGGGVDKQGVPEIQTVISPRVYAVRKVPKLDRSMKKHYIVNMYPTQGNSKRISVGYYWQELLQTIIIFVATKVLRRGVNKQVVPEIQNVIPLRV